MSETPSNAADVHELIPPRTHVCIPGDAVLALGPKAVVGLGSGLYSMQFKAGDHSSRALVFAKYCAAIQKDRQPSVLNVTRYAQEAPTTRRYLCNPGDPVIGVVIRKLSPHYYYLYIGGTALVYMDALAFDGATKTSNPRLNEGALVYGFIKRLDTSANLLDKQAAVSTEAPENAADDSNFCCADSVNVEMSCAASELGMPPKEWTSSEAIFGPLHGGRVVTIPLTYARSLLTPLADSEVSQKRDAKTENNVTDTSRKRRRGERETNEEDGEEEEEEEVPASYLIALLGQRVPFEICIGLNGMVWIKGQESAADPAIGVRRTIAVCACVVEGQQDATRKEMKDRVEKYFPTHV